ncbi:MAG TPA: protein kinase [Vicinamibacterales bacterium]|nr:protein kinase [Vicinamibacterales bacterium]
MGEPGAARGKITTPMLSPGSTLGPYQITKPIGAGGMGRVYEARDTRLGRRVAIKVVSEEFSERFIGEARAVGALNHPHICTLYDIGPNYLVMEYLDGRPLQGPLPLESVREYALQIVDALDAAHRNGIVHCDLKPGNILLTKSGIKLLDFGLAKVVRIDPNGETQALGCATQAGFVVGTFPYMSPEQAEGRTVDERSDMFSFGTVLYELLAGQRPFEGDTQAAIVAALLRDEPRPLKSTRSDISESLALVVDRCLRKRATERFRTAAELKSALALARWDAAADAVSIAVLPFVNANRDDDGEFFADGVTEDIISALAKLPGLRVVARGSAFQFKGRSASHEEVRDKLRVRVIVEGSVRRFGQRIRVTAALINTDNGYQLWSERYDRVVEDVFAIQDEISRAIADKLEVKLATGEKVVANRTQNIEAYNLYLRGRQQWYRRTPAAYRKAEEYFRRAVAEDAGFIPSLVGLADCLSIGIFYGNLDPAEAVPEARKLLDRALAMDPHLAETHTSLGFLETVLLNFAAAEKHFLTSHQLKPDQALTLHWNACLVSAEGGLDQGREMEHRAAQLEPTIPMYLVAEAILILHSGDTSLAIETLRKALEMDAGYPVGQAMLGQALSESGSLDEGTELLRTAATAMAPGGLWARGLLGHYLARKGDAVGARQTLEELLTLRKNGYAAAVAIAAIYVGLGEDDLAVEWLETAAQSPGALNFWIPTDPLWKRLTSHRGFQEILARWKRPSNMAV